MSHDDLVNFATRFKIDKFSTLGTDMLKLLTDKDLGWGELADYISEDPSLSARVLHIANNSVLYASFISGRIESLNLACSRLGPNELLKIILSHKLSEIYNDSKLRDILNFSLLTSENCSIYYDGIFNEEEYPGADSMFSVGLLSRIGFAFAYGERKKSDEVLVSQGCLSIEEQEEKFGFNNMDLGSTILNSLGFPDIFVYVTATNHERKRVAQNKALSSYLINKFDRAAELLRCSEQVSSNILDVPENGYIKFFEGDFSNLDSGALEDRIDFGKVDFVKRRYFSERDFSERFKISFEKYKRHKSSGVIK